MGLLALIVALEPHNEHISAAMQELVVHQDQFHLTVSLLMGLFLNRYLHLCAYVLTKSGDILSL